MSKFILLTIVAGTLSGCLIEDDNAKPKYGKEYGLPVNCRAYVQVAIDQFRAGRFTANETMAGLERNCGSNGNSWIDNREK